MFDKKKYEKVMNVKNKLSDLRDYEEDDVQIFDELKCEFIALFEGLRLKSYYEGTGLSVAGNKKNFQSGLIAVGYGFNMNLYHSRQEWIEAFGNDLIFDEVKSGERALTHAQALKLFRYSLSIREKEISVMYNLIWNALNYNQKLFILSIYYNIPSLIHIKTKFFQHFMEAVLMDDRSEMIKATKCILSYKYPVHQKGMVNRRKMEMLLIDIDYINKNGEHYVEY